MIFTPILLSIGTLLCLAIAGNTNRNNICSTERELQHLKDKETDELDVLFQPKKKW